MEIYEIKPPDSAANVEIVKKQEEVLVTRLLGSARFSG